MVCNYERREKYYKSYKIVISILIILGFLFSIRNDIRFFYWDRNYNENSLLFYLVAKAIFLALLIIFWSGVCKFLDTPDRYVKAIKAWLKYAWPVVVMYTVFLFILWPGNWGAVGDEFQTYLSIKNLRIWPDQGVFSSMFMLLCLMIYHSPASITVIQSIISIVIVGNVIFKYCTRINARKWAWFFLTVLGISLPSLVYLTCPIRAWLFSVLSLALICNLHIWVLNSTDNELLWLIILESVAVSIIRTEGIMLFIIAFAVFIVVAKGKKRLIKGCAIFGACFFSSMISVYVLMPLGNGEPLNQHSALKYVTVLSMILTDEEKYKEISAEDLNRIDAVWGVHEIMDNPSTMAPFNGTRAERSFGEPTKQEVSRFNRTAVKLIMKNIPTFLYTRFEATKMSVGVYPYYRTLGTAWTWQQLEEWQEGTDLPGNVIDDFKGYKETRLRSLFSERMVDTFYFRGISSFYIVYAFWIPIVMLFVTALYCLFSKHWVYLLICGGLCGMFIMVSFMAPGRYQMYYLVFYYLGWFEFLHVLDAKKGNVIEARLEG